MPTEILTAKQMKAVDEETIAKYCPSLELMERAGRAVARRLQWMAPVGDAVFFVGSGNNGGDALVAARCLVEETWPTSLTVFLLKSPEEMSPDARTNYWRLAPLINKGRVEVLRLDQEGWEEQVEEALEQVDVVVDGLLGTGVSGPPRGRLLEVIRAINASARQVIAIDIPSGVQGETGEVPGEAVKAHVTVTIGRPKFGLLFHPGRQYVGQLVVEDIGFPPEVVEAHSSGLFLIDEREILERLPRRAPDAHKYRCGAVLVVAGSRAYTGAAALAAEAALRSGCGIVYLAVPESVRSLLETLLVEVITLPLPETDRGTVAPAAWDALEPILGKVRALVVGPGLDRHEETDRFVRDLLQRFPGPAVLDADGLRAFANAPDALAALPRPPVVTPHSGELADLVGERIPEDPRERVEATRRAARRLNTVLLHKGAPTLVGTPDGEVWVNGSGDSALATAGSGDVLSGLLGGLLAQGASPLDAALVAAYVRGRAGERVGEVRGARGVIASDLFDGLGEEWRHLERVLWWGQDTEED
jgi:NAD(P)H-hydrate epimerase